MGPKCVFASEQWYVRKWNKELSKSAGYSLVRCNVETFGTKLKPWLFKTKCCGRFLSIRLELKDRTVKRYNFADLAHIWHSVSVMGKIKVSTLLYLSCNILSEIKWLTTRLEIKW